MSLIIGDFFEKQFSLANIPRPREYTYLIGAASSPERAQNWKLRFSLL
jgi:hypothetical protein